MTKHTRMQGYMSPMPERQMDRVEAELKHFDEEVLYPTDINLVPLFEGPRKTLSLRQQLLARVAYTANHSAREDFSLNFSVFVLSAILTLYSWINIVIALPNGNLNSLVGTLGLLLGAVSYPIALVMYLRRERRRPIEAVRDALISDYMSRLGDDI